MVFVHTYRTSDHALMVRYPKGCQLNEFPQHCSGQEKIELEKKMSVIKLPSNSNPTLDIFPREPKTQLHKRFSDRCSSSIIPYSQNREHHRGPQERRGQGCGASQPWKDRDANAAISGINLRNTEPSDKPKPAREEGNIRSP